MISLTIQKGFNLNSDGSPTDEIIDLKQPSHVALTPFRIPFIKPKLLVKEGEPVSIGTPLVFDKRNPDIKYLAPGSGTVSKIRLGRRRVIEAIVIKLDKEEKHVDFKKFPESEIESVNRSDLVDALVSGGVFQLFKAFPYGDVPDALKVPSKIYVHLDNSDPYHTPHNVYLNGREALLKYGLAVLKKLSKTIICYAESNGKSCKADNVAPFLTHSIKGKYPSDDPSVVLYHTKTSVDDHSSWHISGQNVLLIAEFLKDGRYPVERFYCVSGAYPGVKGYLKSRMGAPVPHLLKNLDNEDAYKIITGGIFKGSDIKYDSFMGLFETSLHVLPKGDEKELFGFARPGFGKHGNSRTFLSVFNRGPFKINGNQHGELRPCINCSSCADVCAVDILPQFSMKAIHCGELEEAVSYGILDCAECGLCSYVCPSKIELSDIIKQAKRDYYREIN